MPNGAHEDQTTESYNHHINDENGDYVAFWPDDSTSGNDKSVIPRPDSDIRVTKRTAMLVGHTLSLLSDDQKG